MIQNLNITGIKYELNDTTKEYVEKKIAGLDKYLPRHARKSVTADVKISQTDKPSGNKYEVEVVMTVPDKVITAKDSTMNVLAAIDIVEEKLKRQLRKYKQASVPHLGFSRVLSKFKRSYDRES
ncbi:MAG TPA: ribosome-associated translation inhibitor RaiA [Candidatus Saccharibacteria bacterium]|jgi:putative sigma-54 modulation protein|nr:ribosome-associated translation inhibitor RaiA [Candidatus Saccharibacteria bacterium]HMR38778.1 ribosome-associated translation inhibitor RaiA [Candidatus Saccharibacteria bacterium]